MNIKRGDICYANLDNSKGVEQQGCRPVLVIQNNIGNKHSLTTIIAPITSSVTKKQLPVHLTFQNKTSGLPCLSTVLLEQIRVIDKSRLDRKIGYLTSDIMSEVDKALKISVGLLLVKSENKITRIRRKP